MILRIYIRQTVNYIFNGKIMHVKKLATSRHYKIILTSLTELSKTNSFYIIVIYKQFK